jgi:hypothetical protein
LFAFVLVCAGILKQDPKRARVPGRFYTPYINGKYLFPLLVAGSFFLWLRYSPDTVWNLIHNVDPEKPGVAGFEVFKHRIPLVGFLILTAYLCTLSFRKNLSLIPLLGLTSCGYLMTELGIVNWYRFGIWLVAGLVIYFLYGIRNSKLRGIAS